MTISDWVEYWDDAKPRLSVYLASQRDAEMTRALNQAVGFFGFITEDLHEKATRHEDHHLKFAPLLVESLDILRGIEAAYHVQSMAALATMARTAFELRANLAFILTSVDDIDRLADMFERFPHAERLKHSRNSKTFRYRIAEDEAAARKHAPEWWDAKGKLRADHWSGPNRSILNLARDAGLEEEYRSLYSSLSKFIHGSPLLKSMYATANGIGPLPEHVHCARLATLGAYHCLEALKHWCAIFGIPHSVSDLAAVRGHLLGEAKRIEGQVRS